MTPKNENIHNEPLFRVFEMNDVLEKVHKINARFSGLVTPLQTIIDSQTSISRICEPVIPHFTALSKIASLGSTADIMKPMQPFFNQQKEIGKVLNFGISNISALPKIPSLNFTSQITQSIQPALTQHRAISKILGSSIVNIPRLPKFSSLDFSSGIFSSQKALLPINNLFEPLDRIRKLFTFPPDIVIFFKLSNQYWIIEDSELIEHLRDEATKNDDIDLYILRYICDYYPANEWKKLEDIVDRWSVCNFIKGERYNILQDCFKTLKLGNL